MGCFGGRSVDKEQIERSKQIEKQLERDKTKYKSTHRLLLLGLYMSFICFNMAK